MREGEESAADARYCGCAAYPHGGKLANGHGGKGCNRVAMVLLTGFTLLLSTGLIDRLVSCNVVQRDKLEFGDRA
jgi:hypothetical protein